MARIFNLDKFMNGAVATNKCGQQVVFSTMLRNKPGYMSVAIKQWDGFFRHERFAVDGNRYAGVEMLDSLYCE